MLPPKNLILPKGDVAADRRRRRQADSAKADSAKADSAKADSAKADWARTEKEIRRGLKKRFGSD
eukprot:1038479-Prorocentrum_minimum.AAC.2